MGTGSGRDPVVPGGRFGYDCVEALAAALDRDAGPDSFRIPGRARVDVGIVAAAGADLQDQPVWTPVPRRHAWLPEEAPPSRADGHACAQALEDSFLGGTWRQGITDHVNLALPTVKRADQ